MTEITPPKVSIVVLNWNKPEMTIDCLKSIERHTHGVPYEVIVVDNGSKAENLQILQAYDGPHRLIPLSVNRFFGEGNNIGAEHARGKYLLFLNNDVIVTDGWLRALLDPIEADPSIGTIGPKFVYPNGQLQESGALLDPSGNAVQIGKFQDPNRSRFNVSRTVDYVSAACVMMLRSDFEGVLGFDFRYEPAYYEDCDLCLKISALGKRCQYEPSAVVVHHENATTADPSHNLKLGSIVPINREKFVKRWSQYLDDGHHDAPAKPSRAISPNPEGAGKTAAFHTLYNIIPGGGERYLFSTMAAFAQRGYKIILIVPELYSRARLTSVLGSLDLQLPALDIVTMQQAEHMVAQNGLFDFFYGLGNQIYPSSPAMGKHSVYCCQFPFEMPATEVGKYLSRLADYQSIICYSDFVQTRIRDALMQTEFHDMDIDIIYPPVGVNVPGKLAGRHGILGIGRFFAGGHCKRQDMMIRALRELRDRGVDVELNLVGSLHPEADHREYYAGCKQMAEGLPVNFHVDATPEKLADLLRSSSVYWHCAGFDVDPSKSPERCEHFGISVVEAMAAGNIPIVLDRGGPASIVEDGVSGYHYHDLASLVTTTQHALDDPNIGAMRQQATLRSQHFSLAAFNRRWGNIIDAA